MLGKQYQLLAGSTLQIATEVSTGGGGITGNIQGFNSGGVYTSPVFVLDGYTVGILVVHLGATPTGTTPTLTWEVDTSTDGVSFSAVGSALTAMSPSVLDQVTAYFSGSTQGAITGPFFRVKATPAGANALFPKVFAEILFPINS